MAAPPTDARREPWLERLGLHRHELRAWAAYDWANSAFVTTVVTAVFPIYYESVAAGGWAKDKALQVYALTTTLALLAIALVAPILGPIADFRAWRKRFLVAFLALGVVTTACMFFVGPGDAGLALSLFFLANVGAAGSFVFYDSLLPHVARPSEVDRLSTSAYALGYLGGGSLLALQLLVIERPELVGLASGAELSGAEATLPTRLVLLSVAVWWAVFSVPLLYNVPEPPRILETDELAGQPTLKVAVQRLRETFAELRQLRDAFLMMLAFLLYNDGIQTIIRMATFLGALKDFDRTVLIGSILLVQFVGIPFAILFGRLAARIGVRRAILTGIGAYVGITVFAVFMSSALHFLALAVAVGMVMGGTQALSRSLFSTLIPKHKSSEFFSLFGVLEKFAGILGPALFTVSVGLLPEDKAAWSALGIVPFFLGGAWILTRVDIERGRRAAVQAELDTRMV